MTVIVQVKLRRPATVGQPGAIYYSLRCDGANRRIGSEFRLFPEQWDVRRQCVVNPHGDPRLDDIERGICAAVACLETVDLRPVRSAEMRSEERIVGKLDIVEEGFLAYGEQIAAGVERQGRFGTAANYRRALASFAAFRMEAELPLALLGTETICDYDRWLKRRGVLRNSISFYMRNLRALCNRLVRMKLLDGADFFGEVYTGIDRTRKRAADEEAIFRLKHADLPPKLSFARDLFLFSFYCRGMAFVDMAFLKRENLCRDTIRYARHKTGCLLEIGIVPCMQAIIDRYRSDSDYLFPIIRSKDERTAYLQYRAGICQYNRRLKRIGELLGAASPLSSYVSRHSWATIARNRQIPLSLISEGMGHSSESTTRIYLASFDRHLIDEANNRVINI